MIIAIDGASTNLSLALAGSDGELIADDGWESAQRQSAELLPRLLALAERADCSLGETTAVAVGTGPGSFTGLRVAMALAKGLAFGLRRPIVGVPSLGAWLEADPDASGAVARAGAREAYLLVSGAETPIIVDRDVLATAPAGLIAPADVVDAFGLNDTRRPHGAPAIARMAARRLASEPAGDDVSRLEPIYLRPPRGIEAGRGDEVRWL